ncbi:hypothetical protein QDA04_gp67 [Microbacterium phage Megan]|uniref:Uncharacterized protein n=1 Tax=Microbacterium phage Megan TaxID=2656551 RepID=A0A649VK51_9CAUD|nr:hypothetical protein QDA04_gp67 [Microbacterium phage Megan]QGJ92737.1 hypothetical protein PBI_MEGAN_67 [Microbacterium phage Megan]
MTGALGIEEVPPSTPGAVVCGTCGKAWVEDITPASRCPWEDTHMDVLYPEHARLQALDGDNDTIGAFLEWLSEQGYVIAEHGTGEPDDDRSEHRLWAVHRSIESWLAQYFNINPVKISAEKDAMLRAMREAQGLDADGRTKEDTHA